MSPTRDALDRLAGRLRAAGCVFAEEEAALVLAQAVGTDEVEAMVAARVAGQPLEHVLGWVAFAGRRVAVGPGVFVPRRRTELMVREAVALALAAPDDPVVLDLCCGCGAVGAAVAARLATAGRRPEVVAADLDPTALVWARTNLPAPARVLRSDLYEALPADLQGRVRVLTANVPYVPSAAIALMPPEAREHEPRSALDGGPDGLGVLRRLVAGAPRWLAPGGAVLVEVGVAQQPAATAAMARAGLEPRTVRDDDLEATVLVGTRR